MKTETKSKYINELQKKQLAEELSRAARVHQAAFALYSGGPRPAEVKAAERVVARWEKQNNAKHQKVREKIHAAYTQLANRLVFMTPEEAVKAVEAFKAKTF